MQSGNNNNAAMDQERESIKRERELFENEKTAFELNHKKVKEFHSPEPISLNIGGKRFCTTLDTLTKHRLSFFGAMFSGYIALKATKDGSYFIDRDGTHFHYILNYFRTGELIIPENKPHLRKMLLLEAEFYQIEDLISELGDKTKSTQTSKPSESIGELFGESTILSGSAQIFGETLNEWVGCHKDQKWKLIYKGSRDGFKAFDFHQNCDNRGATYTIVKSGNSIFGGYNPHSWLRPPMFGEYRKGEGSFLFSLVNVYCLPPTKLEFCDEFEGPFNESSHLSAFGVSDLKLFDKCDVKGGSSKFKSYENPTQQKNLFTGNYNFKVEEVEVFQIDYKF